jgi:hypothetical protein
MNNKAVFVSKPLGRVRVERAVYCLSLMWPDIIADSMNPYTQFSTSINPIISINCVTVVPDFTNEQIHPFTFATG